MKLPVRECFFYFFLLISCYGMSKAQGLAPAGIQLPNIMSPDVATLGKFGAYEVNYYTGSPNISVPLHQISENGVTIPFGISYDASGFIPNKNAGIAGLNWNLSVGGAITRIVNGRADDSYDPDPVIDPDPFGYDKGYIYGQLQAQLSTYSQEYIRKIEFLVEPSLCIPASLPPCTNQTYSYLNDMGYDPKFNLAYEYEPDIFSFNFLGHTGKFFLGNDGQVKVSSDRRYKVDLSELYVVSDWKTHLGIFDNSISTATLNNTKIISQITMTSDDGYEFKFGGTFKNLEVQFSYANPVNRDVDPESGIINAWYLTQVKTPEGKIIKFINYNYTEDDKDVIAHLFSPNGWWGSIPAGFLEVKLFRNQTRKYIVNSGGTSSMNSGDVYSKSLVKQSYLTKIETDQQTVLLIYSPKDNANPFYDGAIYQGGVQVNVNTNYHTSKIDYILISDNFNGGGIPDGYYTFPQSKSIYFSYANKVAVGGTGNRLFLNSINLNGNIYSFTYTNSDNLPDPITKGVDIWGFYNGKDNNSQLVDDPNSNYGIPGEFEVDLQSLGRDRQAYTNVSTNGMLFAITYPTGGKTEFTFENHQFGKILKRKVSSGLIPVWETSSGIAGGLRIAQITNVPGTTTQFKYTTNYELGSNGPSSGLLIKNEVYKKVFVGNPGNTEMLVSDNNISAASTFNESHIEYKEVVVINSEGFTKYEYSTHETNPDTYNLGSDAYRLTTDRSASGYNYNNQLLRLTKYSSRDAERGKLMKQTFYDGSNFPVKSTEFVYNNDASRDQARVLGVYSPHSLRTSPTLLNPSYFVGYIHSYALYHYHNLPTVVTEKTYSNTNSNPIVTTTTYTYRSNTNPLLSEKTISQSDGTVMKYQYEYPEDYPNTAPYSAMIIKHILTPVVKETVSKIDGGSTVLTINKYNYQDWGNSLFRISNQKTINQQILPNQELDVVSVTQYTTNGMISEASKPNDLTQSFIWDYKKLYLIAQIANADQTRVAYTSFEADGTGGWSLNPGGIIRDLSSPTGKKKYLLTGNSISLMNPIPNSSYILTYWSKNGNYNVSGSQSYKLIQSSNGWSCFEHIISNVSNITISGNGYIDEVRLYPVGASMKTFTYEVMAGITSQCDENNKIVYYEYDIQGRLVVIRDMHRKIIKKYCYNLYGQSENCQTETDAAWQLSGETRCKPCAQNPVYMSNILQKEYVDINPQSLSFGSSMWEDVGMSSNCVPPPDWQNSGAPYCEVVNGVNTGYQLQDQIDMNPCSESYQDPRTIVVGYNSTLCPLPPPCSPGNCSGNDKKCINGVCETGYWAVVSTVYISHGMWECTYAYCFSDGSSSSYTETVTSGSFCAITCF